MIQAINGLQAKSRRNFPAWEGLLPLVLEVLFPPSKQLPGAAGESLASAGSSSAGLRAAAPAGDAANGDLCLCCLPAGSCGAWGLLHRHLSAGQERLCLEQGGQVIARTDLLGSDCSLVLKNPHLMSETNPIVSYHSTAFLESGSSDIHLALLLSLGLTVLLPVCRVNETLSLYISC